MRKLMILILILVLGAGDVAARVRTDRTRFVRDRQVDLVGLGVGTVAADMTQADFDRLVGLDVTLGDRVAHVAAGSVSGKIDVVNNHLRVTGPNGLSSGPNGLSVAIPALPVLPCVADVTIVPGHLHTWCTFHRVPAGLLAGL